MAVYKRGKIYYIDYRYQGERLREKIGTNRKLAENVLAKRLVEIAENRFLNVRKESKTTFFEMCDLFMDTYAKPNKKSWNSDQGRLNTLKKFFGNVPLTKITRQRVEEFKAERANEVEPSTVNRALACLKTVFNRAIDWEKATVNPVKGVKLFKENNTRESRLDGKEELDALLERSPDWLKGIILVAFHTGMRQNEILSLTWKDVDFKNRQVHVCTSKNGEGRYIPINQALLEYLRDASSHSSGPGPYVFYNPDGKPHKRYGYLRTAFIKAVDEALGRDFHFHDLRHTFASNLVMEGVDLRTVGQLLGHKSGYKMTERYAHLSPQHMLDAVNKLNKFADEGEEAKNRSVDNVDTKWTQERILMIPPLVWKADFPLNNQAFSPLGRVAELADAQDLKS